MAWTIQPLEISDNGKPTGRWRLVATSDEDGGERPCCGCSPAHLSADLARACPKAQAGAEKITGVRAQPTEPSAAEVRAWVETLGELGPSDLQHKVPTGDGGYVLLETLLVMAWEKARAPGR